jgi:hypothetical protein
MTAKTRNRVFGVGLILRTDDCRKSWRWEGCIAPRETHVAGKEIAPGEMRSADLVSLF